MDLDLDWFHGMHGLWLFILGVRRLVYFRWISEHTIFDEGTEYMS